MTNGNGTSDRPAEAVSTQELLAELNRRGTGPSVAIGPPMGPEDEAAHKARLAETYADQADAEVAAIEGKLAGWKQALADKKAEAKALRTEATKAQKASD